jgi:hypothetical protein
VPTPDKEAAASIISTIEPLIEVSEEEEQDSGKVTADNSIASSASVASNNTRDRFYKTSFRQKTL